MKRARVDQDGFTLVELLVAGAISLVITGVLGTSMIVALRNMDSSGQRLFNSHDAQITQNYFTTDATSSDFVDVSTTETTCAPDSGDSLLVRFKWAVRPADPTNAIGYEVATYATRTFGGERQIVRYFCTSLASFSATVRESAVILAHGLDPAAAAPTVLCSRRATPSTFSLCTSITAAQPFARVRLTTTSTQTSNQSSDSLTFVVEAARRSVQ